MTKVPYMGDPISNEFSEVLTDNTIENETPAKKLK